MSLGKSVVVVALMIALFPREVGQLDEGEIWALLVAGSTGYANYAMQADICHAYQLLVEGGLKRENIIVMMADDISSNPKNPEPGVIRNRPGGPNVYRGVLKDYTGQYMTLHNFLAVLTGNKTAVRGGSGKVLATKSNDRIFMFYSAHGTYQKILK